MEIADFEYKEKNAAKRMGRNQSSMVMMDVIHK